MSVAESVAAEQPVSAQIVGNAFVHQYYHILHNSPGLVHKFYQDNSTFGRPEQDGSFSITTTMQAINDKIISLNYGGLTSEVKSVDSQDSFNGGVHVLVTGCLTGEDNIVKKFAQSFFLAPQDKGYFVLNDMLQFVDDWIVNLALVSDVAVPPATEPIPALVEVSHVSEQSTPSPKGEVIEGEVFNPPENGDIPIPEEDVPVAAVEDKVHDNTEFAADASAKSSEVPKKSFASIVMCLKENAASFSPPPLAPKKAPPRRIGQVNSTVVQTSDGPVSSLDSFDNEHNQNGEADGHSIYIKGLPMNATEALLEEVFKRFGTIKTNGIQVRSNKQQVFCFGFVEFEEASSVQKALEASPVAIGGRQSIIEEKRSTSSRGNNRVRFQSGRGSGFRSDGVRGRGNYGGSRGGYTKADVNSRGDFGNWGGYRGGSSNRDGYQKLENGTSNGGAHTNRAGDGMANGAAKNNAPRNGGAHTNRAGDGMANAAAKNNAPRVAATA